MSVSHNISYHIITPRYPRNTLRIKVTGLSPQRPKFGPMPVHVGFMVNRVGLEQFFPSILAFSCHPCSTLTHSLTNAI